MDKKETRQFVAKIISEASRFLLESADTLWRIIGALTTQHGMAGRIGGLPSSGTDAMDNQTAASDLGGPCADGRVARFEQLLEIEPQRGHGLPQPVADMIWSRRLLPVITRNDDAPSPFGNVAPIRGAGDMSITYAACPPGTGPSLHTHRRTFETFTVLSGRFEFTLGDNGDSAVTLNPFDVLSVPPGVARAFRNVSDKEGLLQVIITGGQHDVNDIFFPARTAKEIASHGEQYLAYFQSKGLFFDI
ncbi:cupin domain-containing protein [Niveispirillum cyanobacteriorum]|nr:cupin domain-containing protein [Niveispirillum cyanobacteriorum]